VTDARPGVMDVSHELASGEPRTAIGGAGFDWAMTGLSAWFLAGVVLDNWAHAHQEIIGKLETFYTPWHAVLYSGWLAVTGFMTWTVLRNRSRGIPWRGALPPGYWLSFLGVLLFTWGGGFDLVWHTLWGIEVGLDASYSPPHLILGAAWVLILSGPLRAAWRRPPPATWPDDLPMVLSLTLTLSVVSFFTGFFQPLMNPWPDLAHRVTPDNLGQAIGMASILLHTAVLMGFILLSTLRRPLPLGGFTLFFTLSAVLMATGSWPEHSGLLAIACAAIVGAATDVLARRLRPSRQRRAALRLFAVAIPVMFYALHFAAWGLTTGIWWSVHLWAGAIILAGAVGWALSCAFVPPLLPD